MLKDDIRIVEGAMRGNDLLFNYEIAAWNRIKKFIEEAGEQRPTKRILPFVPSVMVMVACQSMEVVVTVMALAKSNSSSAPAVAGN